MEAPQVIVGEDAMMPAGSVSAATTPVVVLAASATAAAVAAATADTLPMPDDSTAAMNDDAGATDDAPPPPQLSTPRKGGRSGGGGDDTATDEDDDKPAADAANNAAAGDDSGAEDAPSAVDTKQHSNSDSSRSDDDDSGSEPAPLPRFKTKLIAGRGGIKTRGKSSAIAAALMAKSKPINAAGNAAARRGRGRPPKPGGPAATKAAIAAAASASGGKSKPKPKVADSDKPTPFKMITSNEYPRGYHKPKRAAEDIDVCSCTVTTDLINPSIKYGCGPTCLNRSLMVECTPHHCPCGDACQNQRFQKRKYPLTSVERQGLKGFGLVLQQPVKRGDLVIEYVGEVIEESVSKERLKTTAQDAHFYLLTLNSNEILDATRKGSNSRFINHSCHPNCETQKWTVDGLLRIGIFALKDMPAKTEVTFDYKFERFGSSKQVCHCGAPNCRGFLGAKPKKGFDTRLLSDSDDAAPLVAKHAKNPLDRAPEELDVDVPFSAHTRALIPADRLTAPALAAALAVTPAAAIPTIEALRAEDLKAAAIAATGVARLFALSHPPAPNAAPTPTLDQMLRTANVSTVSELAAVGLTATAALLSTNAQIQSDAPAPAPAGPKKRGRKKKDAIEPPSPASAAGGVSSTAAANGANSASTAITALFGDDGSTDHAPPAPVPVPAVSLTTLSAPDPYDKPDPHMSFDGLLAASQPCAGGPPLFLARNVTEARRAQRLKLLQLFQRTVGTSENDATAIVSSLQQTLSFKPPSKPKAESSSSSSSSDDENGSGDAGDDDANGGTERGKDSGDDQPLAAKAGSAAAVAVARGSPSPASGKRKRGPGRPRKTETTPVSALTAAAASTTPDGQPKKRQKKAVVSAVASALAADSSDEADTRESSPPAADAAAAAAAAAPTAPMDRESRKLMARIAVAEKEASKKQKRAKATDDRKQQREAEAAAAAAAAATDTTPGSGAATPNAADAGAHSGAAAPFASPLMASVPAAASFPQPDIYEPHALTSSGLPMPVATDHHLNLLQFNHSSMHQHHHHSHHSHHTHSQLLSTPVGVGSHHSSGANAMLLPPPSASHIAVPPPSVLARSSSLFPSTPMSSGMGSAPTTPIVAPIPNAALHQLQTPAAVTGATGGGSASRGIGVLPPLLADPLGFDGVAVATPTVGSTASFAAYNEFEAEL